MREHWTNCITHFDDKVDAFIENYFEDENKRALLVAAAGFDPRSRRVTELLSQRMHNRLKAIFIREERPGASPALQERADNNEASLRLVVPDCVVTNVDIFADDGAPIGGSQIVNVLLNNPIPTDVTDVIVDLTALSIGVGFPAARMLLEECEGRKDCVFHLLIASNPDLDDRIKSDPSNRPGPVKGFAPLPPIGDDGDLDVAQIWIPQLATGLASTLAKIGQQFPDRYKVCPLLPFPSRNPRRADDLVTEYVTEISEEWRVDPRDLVYASERNPLDTYRLLSRLKQRFDRTMEGTYALQMILSPIGSKAMAAGAMMAAIDHDMSIHYVETDQYTMETENAGGGADVTHEESSLVHIILAGPLYANFPSSLIKPMAEEVR
ncbi:hypothetical protein [uncultured Roseobacter sp.]|uniref:hypothetical protein n=1 Tax=uncultured Roseobacter sp. TaxID=114847 RepID=UPI00261E02CB|nr:hypothetical protein [uncultured Roseobacter sp.]